MCPINPRNSDTTSKGGPMISTFPTNATDLSGNGLRPLAPLSCIATETLNGEWDLSLIHPGDDQGKWAWLQAGSIVKAPVPAEFTPRRALLSVLCLIAPWYLPGEACANINEWVPALRRGEAVNITNPGNRQQSSLIRQICEVSWHQPCHINMQRVD